ncbi:hypothetical protein COUCH_15400 [Couchioplanes caeruleus]|uniref:hypothetical protein n=1 Tax=Couchioplanes caeruleus TaxID=56438 RepID=UPI0020BE115F|nr:hypothetical protein [Couchioplanes caeruleus]UQU67568.1 hypothetical protein COUCH_15400 [Couchioplanes caeruleus]
MGASMWDYITPFQPDLAAALQALRRQVFEEQEYYFLPGDDGWPQTMEQLSADEEVHYTGTHSILDISRVIGPDEPDDYGTLRPLRPTEQLRYFGSQTPSRDDFLHAYGQRGPRTLVLQGVRWSGYCTPLFADGKPMEIAIWGFSGD